jgi:hypothetical protein
MNMQVKWVDRAVPSYFALFTGGLDEMWRMPSVASGCWESARWFSAVSKPRPARYSSDRPLQMCIGSEFSSLSCVGAGFVFSKLESLYKTLQLVFDRFFMTNNRNQIIHTLPTLNLPVIVHEICNAIVSILLSFFFSSSYQDSKTA